MPRKDSGPAAERERFIEDWLAGGRRDVAGLSRTYGISRKTAHQWIRRFLDGGVEGLAERTHARRDRAGRVPAEMERRLAAARRAHPTWGPKKLRAVAGGDGAGHGVAGGVDDRRGAAASGLDAAAEAAAASRPDGRAAHQGGRSERALDDRLQGGSSGPRTGCGCTR